MTNSQSNPNVLVAYMDLARLRIAYMVLVSCAIGYILAYRGAFMAERFCWTLLGTFLLAAGSCALNCYIEREQDALMPRTCNRPIPAGIISPRNALIYGAALVCGGTAILADQVNLLAALLGSGAAAIYLALYTPLKRITWLNTSIGSIPGAVPPLIGWASASGSLSAGGWILFAMLFIWQHTHFLPIAWLYKEDYQAGGFQMLPVLEKRGEKTFMLTLATAIILLPVSMLLFGLSLAGMAYVIGAGFFGLILIAASFKLNRAPSRAGALSVLHLSLGYLPVLLVAVIIDRYGMLMGNNFQAWLATLGAAISAVIGVKI